MPSPQGTPHQSSHDRESGDNGRHVPQPPTLALQRIGSLAAEAKEYLSYYLATRLDSTKASLRNAGLYAGVGILGGAVGAAIAVTAAVLLLLGIALGLGRLFGDRFWLGALVVGMVVLGALGLTTYIVLSRLSKSFRRKTVEKYEQRQNWQRGQFGRDVQEAAAARHD